MNPCCHSVFSGRRALVVAVNLGVALAAGLASAQTVGLDLGDLPPGASVTIELEAVIADPIAAGVETIPNSASLTGGNFVAVDSNTTSTAVDAAPDLAIAASDGGVSVQPGGTVAYTLSYGNQGNQDATGVVLTDIVPAETSFDAGVSTSGWVCAPDTGAGSTCTFSVGAVAAGAGGSVVFAVTLSNPVPAGVAEISTTASIADDGAGGADPVLANNVATDTTPIDAAPDLTIAKDDGSVSVVPGSSVAFLLTYGNSGNQGATGVEITETVPANTTFNAGASTAGWACLPDIGAGSSCTLAVGSLAGGGAGGSATFAVTVVDPVPAGLEAISNTASIDDDGANGADQTPADNSASDTTPVTAAPDLTLSKSDGGESAAPGDVVHYTLTSANVGNQHAAGVTLTEAVPVGTTFDPVSSTAGWSCVPDGAAGSTCTLGLGQVDAGAPAAATVFAVVVDAPAAAGVAELTNTAEIADDGANGADATPADNTATVVTPIDAAPDLVVTKTSDSTVVPGATLEYVVAFSNEGTQDATGVELTEEVPLGTTFDATGSDPAWICSASSPGSICALAIGGFAVGSASSALFVLTVDDPLDTAITSITNTVSIADDGSNGADLVADTNEDVLELPVVFDADLRLTKVVDVPRPLRYGTVSFTLETTNAGPRSATGVAVVDVLPSGLVLEGQTPSGTTSYDPGTGVWTIGDLGAGETAALVLEASVAPGPADPAGTGSPRGVFASGNGLAAPVGLAMGVDDRLYVTGSTGSAGRILRFDGLTGAYVDVVSDDLRLVRPNGLVFSPVGELLVAEATLDAVLRVDLASDTLTVFATGGGLAAPAGVAFGPAGDLFVASAGSDEVLRFDGADGSFLGVFAAGGGLVQPDGIVFGPDGHLHVASRGTDQVLRFDGATGDFMDVFASGGGLDQPTGLLFGPGGDLFVASAGTGQVLRFDGATGAFREVFAAAGGLDGPADLELSRGGDLLVASRLTDQVLAYDGFITNTARVVASDLSDPIPENDLSSVSIDWVPVDFGDAPDPSYPTLVASDGARHGVPLDATLFLGSGVDAESDGQPTAVADGDDLAGIDDEDGVTFISELVQGQPATVTVVASAAARLSAWFDFDGDGGWSATERAIADVAVVAGENTLSLAVPAGANLGPVVARFRLSSAAIAEPTGAAPDGEVEDHLTPPVLPPPVLSFVKTDHGVTAEAGGVIEYLLYVSNAAGSGTAEGVVISEAMPAHTTFAPAQSDPGWSCAGGTCTLAVGSLPGAGEVGVAFAVTVDATLPAGVELIVNSAAVSAANAATVGASDTTPVVAVPDLIVSKDDGGVVPAPGEVLVYQISVSNSGTQGATGVVVAETVPVGTRFSATGSSAGWSCSDGAPEGSPCTLGLGALAAGSSASRSFAVTMADPPTVIEVANTVSVSDDGANGPDPAPSDNTFTLTTALDQVPPTVVSVDTDGLPVVECGTVPSFGRSFRVGFSEPMFDPAGDGDADDVTNPANWLVLGSGPDEDLSTDACGSVFGDDQAVSLMGVGWDEAGSAATLQPAGMLSAGLYRLVACGSTTLVDRGGHNPLDGDGDGAGGDDFVRTFRLDPLNAFTNGHLDCDAEGWELTSSTPGEIAWSPVDSAGSSLSGSLELRQLGVNTTYRVAQCVPAQGGADLPLAASMELDLTTGFASLTLGCRHFEAAGCAGADLGIDEATYLQGDTGGGWLSFAETFSTPEGALSARCSVRLNVPNGQGFTAHLDRLYAGRAVAIFADGFESGDTSAWSTTVGGSR